MKPEACPLCGSNTILHTHAGQIDRVHYEAIDGAVQAARFPLEVKAKPADHPTEDELEESAKRLDAAGLYASAGFLRRLHELAKNPAHEHAYVIPVEIAYSYRVDEGDGTVSVEQAFTFMGRGMPFNHASVERLRCACGDEVSR